MWQGERGDRERKKAFKDKAIYPLHEAAVQLRQGTYLLVVIFLFSLERTDGGGEHLLNAQLSIPKGSVEEAKESIELRACHDVDLVLSIHSSTS